MISPFAFVLMPFDQAFDDIYKFGIQAAAAETGVVAERVDEQKFTESILDRIYRQIDVADMIVADMSGRNPNVFYEVGFAHAKNKLCVLLAQNADDIPFDLKHHRHLIYDSSIKLLKPRLMEEFLWLKSEIAESKEENITVTVRHAFGTLVKNQITATGELDLILDIHNRSAQRSPEIEAMYLHARKDWRFTQDGQECSSNAVEGKPEIYKYFIKSPVNRLSKGAWAPLKLTGKKIMWSKYRGDELKSSYTVKGIVRIEIVTSEGNLIQELNLDVVFDEFPF